MLLRLKMQRKIYGVLLCAATVILTAVCLLMEAGRIGDKTAGKLHISEICADASQIQIELVPGV